MVRQLGILVLLLALIAGCTNPAPIAPDSQTFNSVDELTLFLKNVDSDRSWMYARSSLSGTSAGVPMDARSDVAVSEYGKTNVQVQGVDELDQLKNDGTYIYIVEDGKVFTIGPHPSIETLSIINTSEYVAGIFVEDTMLYTISQVWDKTSSVVLRAYDITDRAKPIQVEEYFFEGSYAQARLVNNTVVVITTMYPELRPIPMPMVKANGVESTVSLDRIATLPFFPYGSGVQYINVHKVSDRAVSSQTLIANGYPVLYMTHDTIYIGMVEYVDTGKMQQDVTVELLDPYVSLQDREYFLKLDAVDTEILSTWEKESKKMARYYDILYALDEEKQQDLQKTIDAAVQKQIDVLESLQKTHITKISLDDVSVQATGTVAGFVYSQFAFDEYDGHLRVATTQNKGWQSFDSNNVFVLDAMLEPVGELRNLAPNESIYAVRYVKDRVYVVTFRQVDPFFVIDVSEPTNPVLLGELKIPGFSKYLHPLNETHIIGIGQDATDTGRVLSMKMGLFDVTDPTNPREISQVTNLGDYSSALSDHHDFVYYAQKNMIVVPYADYQYDMMQGRYEYKPPMYGAVIVTIKDGELTKKGVVEHPQMVSATTYIDSVLYSYSYRVLRAHDVDSLSLKAEKTLFAADDSMSYPQAYE